MLKRLMSKRKRPLPAVEPKLQKQPPEVPPAPRERHVVPETVAALLPHQQTVWKYLWEVWRVHTTEKGVSKRSRKKSHVKVNTFVVLAGPTGAGKSVVYEAVKRLCGNFADGTWDGWLGTMEDWRACCVELCEKVSIVKQHDASGGLQISAMYGIDGIEGLPDVRVKLLRQQMHPKGIYLFTYTTGSTETIADVRKAVRKSWGPHAEVLWMPRAGMKEQVLAFRSWCGGSVPTWGKEALVAAQGNLHVLKEASKYTTAFTGKPDVMRGPMEVARCLRDKGMSLMDIGQRMDTTDLALESAWASGSLPLTGTVSEAMALWDMHMGQLNRIQLYGPARHSMRAYAAAAWRAEPEPIPRARYMRYPLANPKRKEVKREQQDVMDTFHCLLKNTE